MLRPRELSGQCIYDKIPYYMVQYLEETASHRPQLMKLLAGILIIGLAIGLGLYIRHRTSNISTNAGILTNQTPTPDSYNDVIGIIRVTHDTSLTVEFKGIDHSGKMFSKVFRVQTDNKTDIQVQTTKNNERVFSPARLSDMKVGDTVFVAADKNIAPLNEFTATKIYLYQPTS